MIQSLKQRATLANKKNYYYISEDMFSDMAAELAERIIESTIKPDKTKFSDISANKDT